MRHLRDRPMRVSVRIDGEPPLRRRARSVLVANVGRLQGGVRLLADAEPDDGWLDVAILTPRTVGHWAALGWAVLRRRGRVPRMETFRGHHVVVASNRPQPRQLDGDVIEPGRALDVRVRAARDLAVRPAARRPPRPVARRRGGRGSGTARSWSRPNELDPDGPRDQAHGGGRAHRRRRVAHAAAARWLASRPGRVRAAALRRRVQPRPRVRLPALSRRGAVPDRADRSDHRPGRGGRRQRGRRHRHRAHPGRERRGRPLAADRRRAHRGRR